MNSNIVCYEVTARALTMFVCKGGGEINGGSMIGVVVGVV